MLKLTFRQTKAEAMVRTAATIVFDALTKVGFPLAPLSQLADHPQYGFTASASEMPIGPKFVRITDLHDAGIDWETVPFCKCEEPEKYLLHPNDLLFARTGATTGKTVLVTDPPEAVFASYLIRVHPQPSVMPEYLYSFFQSDSYWGQISDSKEGSAQPNVNGQKLMGVTLPLVDTQMQASVARFLRIVRARQEGSDEPLPNLSPPLAEQRQIISHVEELAAKIEEARALRVRAAEETKALPFAAIVNAFSSAGQRVLLGQTNACEIICGQHLTPDEQASSGIPYMTGPADFGERTAVPSRYAKSASALARPGDVLLTVKGAGVGKVNLAPGMPAAIGRQLYALRPRPDRLDQVFLYYALREGLQHFREAITATTVPGIGRKDVERLSIPFPTLSEQRKIAAHLDAFQEQIDALEARQAETAAELDALMPSILAKAFRGDL